MKDFDHGTPARPVKSTNVTRVRARVDAGERAKANGHRGGILWLTGLSGAGKSTIAMETERQLFHQGYQVFVLDGDNVRHGLCADLGFSPEDRAENIRRVGEVANLLSEAGFVVIAAFISPYRADRDRVRRIAPDRFHEVHVRADIETCMRRDPKGLYKRALAGEIPEFTGVSAPYEEPEAPELVVDTSAESPEESVRRVVDYVAASLAVGDGPSPRGG